jgi:hypothetical protein
LTRSPPPKGDNVVVADMDFPLFYVEAKRLSWGVEEGGPER